MPIRTIANVVEILPAVPKIITTIPATTGPAIKNHRVVRTIIPVNYLKGDGRTARLEPSTKMQDHGIQVASTLAAARLLFLANACAR
jgi:hypothetical protein